MNARYELKDFVKMADNEQYADIYVGEKCIAHIARARFYDRDRRPTVTLYNEDMSTHSTRRYLVPRFHIKEHARNRGLI